MKQLMAFAIAKTVAGIGSTAVADVFYYSATGYSDQARTTELFTVTGSDEPPNTYVNFNNIFDFEFTWSGDSSATDTSDETCFQQVYADPPGPGGRDLSFTESKFGRYLSLCFDWAIRYLALLPR